MLDSWIEKNGTPELQRALAEGYAVAKGVATLLVERIADEVDLDLYEQAEWLEFGERTSPRAEAFAHRDRVVDVAREQNKPEGWTVDVSRISRVALLDGSYFTGVLLDVRDADRRHLTRVALNFESTS